MAGVEPSAARLMIVRTGHAAALPEPRGKAARRKAWTRRPEAPEGMPGGEAWAGAAMSPRGPTEAPEERQSLTLQPTPSPARSTPFPAMSTPNHTPTTGTRLDRLRHTLNQLEHQARMDEQAAAAGYGDGCRSPFDATRDDLRALLALLAVAAVEMPAAANVPEWDNHSDDDGHPGRLGGVACTYAAWIEEGEDEPVAEHDGANQLGELAKALGHTLDALDALAFDAEGMPL